MKTDSETQGDGAALIAAERKRQIEQEDWTPRHDDEHTERELARAAACYLRQYNARSWVFANPAMPWDAYRNEPAPDDWPWDSDFWNPKNPERDLIRAGALIAAELDRLMRAS